MIILDKPEGVHRIIMVCKHRSIRMHVYMHVCSKGTDVFIWGTIGLSKHVGSFLHAQGLEAIIRCL